ncbi:class I SAM-dependent methyltransferase [Chitinophagaceae bacterium MMS25-I14]
MQPAPLIDLYDRSPLSRQINTVVNNHSGRTYPVMQDIPVLLHGLYLNGNGDRYKKMYERPGYDFAEKLIDKLFYGNRAGKARREIMQQPAIKNGDRILYISIGTGTGLQYLPENIDISTLEITGTDTSMSRLQQCRKTMKKTGIKGQLINCCAEALPFEDNYFDVVLHVGGTDFFSDKDAAMREMIRVAKAGTSVIMVADETKKLIRERKNNLFTRGYFNNIKSAAPAPFPLIPAGMNIVRYRQHLGNRLYSIIFQKPAVTF